MNKNMNIFQGEPGLRGPSGPRGRVGRTGPPVSILLFYCIFNRLPNNFFLIEKTHLFLPFIKRKISFVF